jgi:hypothetical protein
MGMGLIRHPNQKSKSRKNVEPGHKARRKRAHASACGLHPAFLRVRRETLLVSAVSCEWVSVRWAVVVCRVRDTASIIHIVHSQLVSSTGACICC